MKDKLQRLVRSFKRFKICPYCGLILAWRWVWDVEPCIVHTGTGSGIVLDLWPTHWRRLIDGACPCIPPANKEVSRE